MEPSKPVALPLKAGAETTVAGGGEPPYDGNMEHRITALEARWDAIFPTLATKADLAALGADLRAELRDGLHQNAMAISSLRSETQLSFGGISAEMRQSFGEVNAEMRQSFGEVRAEMQKSFSEVRAEMQRSSGEVHAEMQQSFSGVRAEMQHSNGEVRTEMQKLSSDIKTWMLATVLTIIGTVLAAIIGIGQVQKATPPAPIVITIPAAK